MFWFFRGSSTNRSQNSMAKGRRFGPDWHFKLVGFITVKIFLNFHLEKIYAAVSLQIKPIQAAHCAFPFSLESSLDESIK